MQGIHTTAVRFRLCLLGLVTGCSAIGSSGTDPAPGGSLGHGGTAAAGGLMPTGGAPGTGGWVSTGGTGIVSDGGTSGNSGTPPSVPHGPVAINLNLPPRRQADSGGGFCGETSLQTIALYYGAYISQQFIRTLAGGPALLGNSTEAVIGQLHLRYASWDFAGTANPQFQPFMTWMKSYLAAGVPVIFAVWIADRDGPDPDYDHLMPAFGVESDGSTGAAFNSKDTLIFNTNLSTAPLGSAGAGTIVKAFASLSAVGMSSTTCPTMSFDGGCVPWNVDYGTAVLGIADNDHATLPVRLEVDNAIEPDVSVGQAPIAVHVTATALGLQAGKNYVLLRYTDYRDVPESGASSTYLDSKTDAQIRLTASGSTYVYKDPKDVLSNTAVFYRCVPAS